MKITVVPAQPIHAHQLAQNMRERAALGNPDQPLLLSKLVQEINDSIFAYTGFVDDEIACIYGIRAHHMLAQTAFLWLITSNLADDYPFTFARHSRMTIEQLLVMYPTITGVVEADYTRSIRWLRWLGAKIGPTKLIDGHKLKQFTIGAA